MRQLTTVQIFSLGFMTFALFLGAGNIIFPAAAGLQSGSQLWLVALGFLLTGVGLPLATVIALAKVGGGLPELAAPLGRMAATVFAIAVYLAIGPLFATPRTAVVAHAIGFVPFFGDRGWSQLLFTGLYFSVVLYLALNPGRILERVGQLITPVLLAALVLLGLAAIFKPAGVLGEALGSYASEPVTRGFLDGYLTMDALGALVFGVVIAGAIRSQGVDERSRITRHSIQAGLIAAVCLSLVYLSLFYLGATSSALVPMDANGGQLLAAYVQHAFGPMGSLLLALVITLACLTTATGLLVACGEYFFMLWRVRYQRTVIFFTLFSWLVANQGLDQLIKVSAPVLVGLYPLAIVLVLLSFLRSVWRNPQRVFRVAMAVTLVFGILDGLTASGLVPGLSRWLHYLPLASQQLGWLVPVSLVIAGLTVFDRLQNKRNGQAKK